MKAISRGVAKDAAMKRSPSPSRSSSSETTTISPALKAAIAAVTLSATALSFPFGPFGREPEEIIRRDRALCFLEDQRRRLARNPGALQLQNCVTAPGETPMARAKSARYDLFPFKPCRRVSWSALTPLSIG